MQQGKLSWKVLVFAFLGMAIMITGKHGITSICASDIPKNRSHKLVKKVSKKTKKGRSHKRKFHKPGKSKNKKKKYTIENIEKLLKNDSKEEVCNRLNCASQLKTAKSCLKTRISHRKKKSCFRAFCAYGCNEEDYRNKPEVYEFCNQKCASKKYSLR